MFENEITDDNVQLVDVQRLEDADRLINCLASALDGQNNDKFPVEMQIIAKDTALDRFEEYKMQSIEKWQPVDWEMVSEITDEGFVISIKAKE